ncbi:MAG: TetR family transcriptional regulator [Candidatus Velthaea sp.]
MARRKDPALRTQLLDAIVEVVEREGLSALALRPLGDAVGASPRTLLYHFGSKDDLVAAVHDAATGRLRALIARWAYASVGYGVRDLVRRAWSWLAAPRNRGLVALFFESAATQASPAAAAIIAEWHAVFTREFARRGLARDRANVLASLTTATLHGCMLDVIATNDRARVNRAFASFLAAIE